MIESLFFSFFFSFFVVVGHALLDVSDDVGVVIRFKPGEWSAAWRDLRRRGRRRRLRWRQWWRRRGRPIDRIVATVVLRFVIV